MNIQVKDIRDIFGKTQERSQVLKDLEMRILSGLKKMNVFLNVLAPVISLHGTYMCVSL